jgi:hypothetical protein
MEAELRRIGEEIKAMIGNVMGGIICSSLDTSLLDKLRLRRP